MSQKEDAFDLLADQQLSVTWSRDQCEIRRGDVTLSRGSTLAEAVRTAADRIADDAERRTAARLNALIDLTAAGYHAVPDAGAWSARDVQGREIARAVTWPLAMRALAEEVSG